MIGKLKFPLLAVCLAAVAGIAVGVMLVDGSSPPTAVSAAPNPGAAADSAGVTEPAAAQIDALKRQLQTEISARRALEQKLEALSRQVAALDSVARSSVPAGENEQSVEDSSRAGGSQTGWFDEQALLDNGIDSGLVSELKGFYEQLEMEQLYLRDRSAREGWDREKLRSELRGIESREDELRQRFGDSAYDAYLYASGQPNRVAVTSVLASAQAGQAGIQSGDHIVRYDNERIYNWMDLRAATTGGSISDTVEVEVERDGETLQFYLARGPMGIRMDSLSVPP